MITHTKHKEGICSIVEQLYNNHTDWDSVCIENELYNKHNNNIICAPDVVAKYKDRVIIFEYKCNECSQDKAVKQLYKAKKYYLNNGFRPFLFYVTHKTNSKKLLYRWIR